MNEISEKKKLYRNMIIFIWHAFFLALTVAMLDFNTVFPSLVTKLTESTIILGLLYSILLGVNRIFNVIFSYYMQYSKYKKKFLITGIYLRSLSYLGMALVTYLFAKENPVLVIVGFFFWITVFSLSGGFAGLAYTDIIGKLFNKNERGKVYVYKQFFSSVAAFLGGLVVTGVFSLSELDFPVNYSLILLIGFAGLIVAAISFWFIKEPPTKVSNKNRESLITFIKKIPGILKKDRKFSFFILIENMTSLSLMALPFYMVYIKDLFVLDEVYIGRYLLFLIGGSIISNFFWGYISNKLGSKTVVRLCIFLGSLIPVIALIVANFGPDIYVIVFVLIGFIVSGRRIGFDPYFLEIAPKEDRTVYLGIRGTLSFLVVLMPAIGGLIIELLGYNFTFITVTVTMLIALYLTVKKIQGSKA